MNEYEIENVEKIANMLHEVEKYIVKRIQVEAGSGDFPEQRDAVLALLKLMDAFNLLADYRYEKDE